METNSVYSNSHKKEEKPHPEHEFLNQKQIVESISDSLDDLAKPSQAAHQAMLSSHYGFGEKVMNKFMEQIERPYSPPLGERELTEEQHS